MNFEELLEKYQALLVENSSLKEEIENLNTKLGVSKQRAVSDKNSDSTPVNSSYPTPHAKQRNKSIWQSSDAQSPIRLSG